MTQNVEAFIREKLQQDWSLEQICGYAKRHELFSLSHERIYHFILKDQEKGGKLSRNGPIKDRIFIDDRPKVVNEKGCDFSHITDQILACITDKLNNRPRKSLGYATPNEVFNKMC